MTEFLSRLQQDFRAAFPGDDRRIVPMQGPADAPRLMLIGEAPGRFETEQGRPFVGKAGQNLNEFLAAIGLERAQILVSNVVKVRPFRVSEKGTVSNRPPNRQELAFFVPRLHEEIAMIRPQLLVTLGNTALQALLPGVVIGACHGQLQQAQVQGSAVQVFPLYHPASIIYNRDLKDVYAQDVQILGSLLR